jgi:hypothetical protein
MWRLEVDLFIPFEVWIVGQYAILRKVDIHLLLDFRKGFLNRFHEMMTGESSKNTSSALFKSTRLAIGSESGF